MKTKVEIKDINGKVLFVYECEDNTIKKTVEEAVSRNISLHNAYLSGSDLYNANLHWADLRNADLSGARLTYSDLRNANLYGANLNYAKVHDANLCDADLYGVNLRNAYLHNADLRWADLRNVDLYNADLRGVDLYGTILYGTDLYSAKNVPFIPFACPNEGSFIAWKKVDKYLIKLFIPEDAKRSSATTSKCRCDKAKVLEITNLTTNEHVDEIVNENYTKCMYKVDKMVYPDSFDDNRWNECSNGIHFFIDKQEAIDYCGCNFF